MNIGIGIGIGFEQQAAAIAANTRLFATFDGTDDYIAVPTMTAAGDFEYEAEFSTTTTTAFDVILSDSVSGQIGARLDSSFFAQTQMGTALTLVTGTTALNDGKLHNVKVSRVGQIGTITVDGVVEGTVNNVSVLGDQVIDRFGIRLTSNRFEGVIANVSFTSGFTSADGATSPIVYALDDADMIARSNKAVGVELVVNGDFATDSDWVKGSTTISGGTANFTTTNGSLDQNIAVTTGEVALLAYEITSNTSDGTFFISSVGFGGASVAIPSTVGAHNVVVPVVDDTKPLRFIIISATTGELKLDNVSVRNAPAYGTYENFEIDFSDRELMNRQGNGDWLAGDTVVNGGFDTDSDWTKGTGWSIAGGVAEHNGAFGALAQSTVVSVGMTYSISTLLNTTSGGACQVDIGGAPVSLTEGASSLIETAASSTLTYSAGSFIGNIDNVSVKRILQAPA